MASIKNNSIHAFWQNHLTQWQSSGLSQAKYCRQHKLVSHQFSYWKCKLLANSQPASPATKIGFARVQIAEVTEKQVSPSLSLRFQNGIEVLGVTLDNMPLIRQLVEVLR